MSAARPPANRPLAEAAEAAGVRDRRLLDAMRRIRRSGFVPDRFAGVAGQDVPVPIGHAQVTTQPSLVAAMVEALALEGSETVLEIGTGHGYQTALLASLADRVWSVERWPELAAAARANLAAAGIANVEVVVGDGTTGLPERAPFDAILVSAAFPDVPGPLAEQLARGGRLVQPIGPGSDDEVTLFIKRDGRLRRHRIVAHASFVPLVGRHGHPPGRP